MRQFLKMSYLYNDHPTSDIGNHKYRDWIIAKSVLFWLWTSPVGLDRTRSTGRDVPRRLRDAEGSNEAVHAPSPAISSPCHSLRSPIRL